MALSPPPGLAVPEATVSLAPSPVPAGLGSAGVPGSGVALLVAPAVPVLLGTVSAVSPRCSWMVTLVSPAQHCPVGQPGLWEGRNVGEFGFQSDIVNNGGKQLVRNGFRGDLLKSFVMCVCGGFLLRAQRRAGTSGSGAVLGCAGLCWAVLGCAGMYWAVLGGAGAMGRSPTAGDME